jgi:hypothetical protein
MPARAATWFAPTHTCPPDHAAAPPTLSLASKTTDRRPRRAVVNATARPDRPAPTTITGDSSLVTVVLLALAPSSVRRKEAHVGCTPPSHICLAPVM